MEQEKEAIILNKFKQFIIGMIVGGLIISGIPVLAESGLKTIEVTYNNIRITLNGKEIKTDVEPFQFSGRTFLPIRQVAEALGATVNWNSTTNTVEIVKSISVPAPMPTPTPIPKKEINTSITYEMLARSANDYKGELVKFTGKVVQSSIGSDVSVYRVDIKRTGDNWDGTILLECNNNNVGINFLEGDFIDFTGEVLGYYTYTSIAGLKITIPDIKALSASLNSTIKQELQSKEQEQKDLEREKVLNYRAKLEREHEQRIDDLIAERLYHEVRTGESHRIAINDINKQINEENADWEELLEDWKIEDRQNGY
jgi:hypothetical protein